MECPANKSVNNVEPDKSTDEAVEEREAGGVFWVAGVESTVCKTCDVLAEKEDGSSTVRNPKKSLSYRNIVLKESTPKVPTLKSTVCNHVPLSNKYEALSEESESTGKITIDSGAADCVMPKEVLKSSFPLLPAKEGVKFCAANGTPIQNYGSRNVLFITAGRKGVNCVKFHVTDVKKPLASVSRIVEKGSSAHFTPAESYIHSPSGEKIKLELEKGVYVMDVECCSVFARHAQ